MKQKLITVLIWPKACKELNEISEINENVKKLLSEGWVISKFSAAPISSYDKVNCECMLAVTILLEKR